jgi:hypothetical protein
VFSSRERHPGSSAEFSESRESAGAIADRKNKNVISVSRYSPAGY